MRRRHELIMNMTQEQASEIRSRTEAQKSTWLREAAEAQSNTFAARDATKSATANDRQALLVEYNEARLAACDLREAHQQAQIDIVNDVMLHRSNESATLISSARS